VGFLVGEAFEKAKKENKLVLISIGSRNGA
jgi:uncharacterized protein YyaL (SSP411 family)